MSKLGKILAPGLSEAAYPGNIGFEEMVKFYREAKDADIKRLEIAIEKSDWEGFKRVIKSVIGVQLK